MTDSNEPARRDGTRPRFEDGRLEVIRRRRPSVLDRCTARSKRRVVAVAVAVLSVFALGSAAFAGGGGDTDEVLATLDFSRVQGQFRLCEGQDGTYDEEKGVASGTSTGDPRLSGRFEVHFTSLDRLTDEGHLGTVRGTFEVFDPDTGKKKVDATFHFVQRYGEERGVIVGRVVDEGTGPSEETTGAGTLVANVQISFVEEDGTFDVVGQIGGTSDSTQMPAVIQRGHCTGPFEDFAFDLPLSTAG